MNRNVVVSILVAVLVFLVAEILPQVISWSPEELKLVYLNEMAVEKNFV